MEHKYEYSKLKEIVYTSTSLRQVLDKLGVVPAGGNYATLKNYLKEYKIDISHFKGQAWNKGKKLPSKKPIEYYLKNNFSIQSYKLKRRLLKENIFKHECFNCKKETWFDQPIPLELHHIDGNNLNNSLSNLILVCPNCHALTSNYRGKNIKNSGCQSRTDT